MATTQLIAELHTIKETMCDIIIDHPLVVNGENIYTNISEKNYYTTCVKFEKLLKFCIQISKFDFAIKKLKLEQSITNLKLYGVVNNIIRSEQTSKLFTSLIDALPTQDSEIHKIYLKDGTKLRTLTQNDSIQPITNLADVNHIQFYFHNSQAFPGVFLFYKGPTEYLLADNNKLYTIVKDKIVQGCHNNKLQCWKKIQNTTC